MSNTDSKEALANANTTVRNLRQKLKTEQKNQAQLTKLLKISTAQADVLAQLDTIQNTRKTLPAFLSSPQDIETTQQSNLNYVVQKARGTLLSAQRGRLEKRLQGQGIDTANLSGAQQQAKQKIEATQGYLGAEQGTRQKLSQQRRTEVIDGFQTRQNKIGKLGGLASQGLTLSGQAFSAGKSLFAPGMAFEQQMSDVQAQLGLDNNDPRLLALRQQATGMAAKAQSPQDAALAQSTLANAGYNPQEVLTAAPAALNLAKASGSSIDETVKTLAGIQQAFQLPADQAEKIADVMAKASSSYQLSLGDLDKKLRAAAPAALKNGMDLEQTAAQLAPQGSSLGNVDGAAQAMVTVRGDNLDGDIQKLFSSWDSIRIDLFDGQNSSLRKLTQTATGWLTTLSQWSTENPALANSLITVAIAITALIGGLSAIGTFIVPALSAINMLMAGAALLGTVFTAIGGVIAGAFAALSLPIIAVVAAIIGGAALIYKYWEPISAFMGGVAEGFIAAIAPIVEGFSPLLSVFDAIIGLVKKGFSAIQELLTPVKMTQEGLNSAASYGKIFGEVLTTVLTLPIALFAKLSGSIVKLLKTLGLLSTTPPELDEDQIKAAKNDLASSALQDNAAVQNYQPAIAPGAVSTANNRNITNHMTINTTPGMDRQEVEQIIATVNQRNQLDSENAAYSNYHFT